LFTVYIDDTPITAGEGQTILQVAHNNEAKRAGIFIPSLCFDATVAAGGACGLCLVEIAGAPRPMRACATVAAPGMAVRTNTPRLRAMQKQILEWLLSVHRGECVAPCQGACPAETDCAKVMALAAAGRPAEAVATLYEAHPFPVSLAYICPRPCEGACRRAPHDEALNIAGVKQALAQQAATYLPPLPTLPANAPTVAVIGGGPAGLTAAYFLRRAGIAVTVYDRQAQMGGLLRYGIPHFRLPKNILDAELAVLTRMGIRFKNNQPAPPLETLQTNYNATIVAIGAAISKPAGFAGEGAPCVVGGTDYLRAVAEEEEEERSKPWGTPPPHPRKGRQAPLDPFLRVARSDSNDCQAMRSKDGVKGAVPPCGGVGADAPTVLIVIGGSNTAMDAARTALRRGARRVTVVYRRTRQEMPALAHEVAAAEAEGVAFRFLAAPLALVDGGLQVQIMALGEPDTSGRRAPVPTDEVDTIAADLILTAVGQGVDAAGFDALPLTRWKTLAADPHTFATEIPNVYVIGDATGESAYAVEAIAHARRAAAAISTQLLGHAPLQLLPPGRVTAAPAPPDVPHSPRQAAPAHEAARCLQCGCDGAGKCQLLSLANRLDATFPPPTAVTPTQKAHDPHKCVLCGLCVRVCPQGLLSPAHRGMRTVICTDLLGTAACHDNGNPCRRCADTCPTGAMTNVTTAPRIP